MKWFSVLSVAILISRTHAFAPRPALSPSSAGSAATAIVGVPREFRKISSSSSLSLLASGGDVGDHFLLLDTIRAHLPQVIQQEAEPFKYAFMFPTVLCVTICCQCAGIGGASLLSPVFLLVFPLLGPQYPLSAAASAIASALLTECCGFSSGLSGFWRRGLVDWNVVAMFAVLSMPAALAGAWVAPSLASQTTLLRGAYAALMLGLCFYLTVSEKPDALPEDCELPPDVTADNNGDETNDKVTNKVTADGTVFTYIQPKPPISDLKATCATVGGASLTGLLGVGIGEVVLPQLVRVACMPLPVAAGTSVAVVVLTAFTAATVQFASLAAALMVQQPELSLSQAFVEVVPWELVQYTVPGAIIGGQIAPWIAASRLLDDEVVEKAVTVLFGIIGVAFASKCFIG